MDLAPFLNRIRAWNPALPLAGYRADPYGLNNLVIIARYEGEAGEWVFRFARSEESRAGLRREAAVLELARPRLSIAVPDFHYEEPGDMVVYRLLEGRPLYRHDLLRLAEAGQERFAADLARFLRDLHSIRPAEAPDLSLPQPARLSRAEARELWAGRLDALRKEVFPYLWADQHAWIEDLFAPVLDGRLDMAHYAPALVHNDLASYHLLVSEDGRLAGVLDFGEASWGDPAMDYAAVQNTYGESLLRRMARTDPAILAGLERARFRAAYLELEWALKGVRSKNPEWFLVHLGRARDSLPFGTE